MAGPKLLPLTFSVILGAMVVSSMALVMTLVNPGPVPGFLLASGKAFAIAHVVAIPVIFFLARREETDGAPARPVGLTDATAIER